MRLSGKPIRKCYCCLLNLGATCWLYVYPRGQWRDNRRCPAFENEQAYRQFREWRKMPDVKTRTQLRREIFRSRPGKRVHRGILRRKKGRKRF